MGLGVGRGYFSSSRTRPLYRTRHVALPCHTLRLRNPSRCHELSPERLNCFSEYFRRHSSVDLRFLPICTQTQSTNNFASSSTYLCRTTGASFVVWKRNRPTYARAMAALATAILPAYCFRLPASTSSLTSKFTTGRNALITHVPQRRGQKELPHRSQGVVRMAASVAAPRVAGTGGRGKQDMEGKVVVVTGANTGNASFSLVTDLIGYSLSKRKMRIRSLRILTSLFSTRPSHWRTWGQVRFEFYRSISGHRSACRNGLSEAMVIPVLPMLLKL